MMVIGVVQLARGKASEALRGNTFADSSASPGNYALALFSGLFAFSSWEAANLVAGEMKNTARDLPRIIFISLSTVTVVYILANISYLIVLPKELISHSNTVALDFGRQTFGPTGGLLFALVVAVSCFGSLHG
jgi:amino acid transporter